ncbi:MAG: Hsp33 family molecular chaperone HslO [Pseudomonadaceae bacterium]|nr:MAG: Hsp33 family molecular chaperone HslO [Pseudomonadaceae bacterium]
MSAVLDTTQRFLFDDQDVRGEIATLEHSYQEILSRHPYPEPVKALLGEMLAATVLLSTTLKFEGLLVLQARSSGPVSTLMVECSSNQEVRGIARYEDGLQASQALHELMPNGVLTITIDPENGQRYQGIVSLEGSSLADALNGYFASSEQLPTRFRLQADGRKARGFLLQALPANRVTDPEARANAWEHFTVLAASLTPEEQLALDNETILHRLFHQEAVRLFSPRPVRFHCSCSAERSGNALISLGREDAMALLAERDGEIEVDCQFCNQRYTFDADALDALFDQAADQAQRLH